MLEPSVITCYIIMIVLMREAEEGTLEGLLGIHKCHSDGPASKNDGIDNDDDEDDDY